MQVPVSDTVGCGDSFAAAIVLGYVRKYDIPATVALANAVGAATAMGTGAGTNVAAADNVLRLLSTAAQRNGTGPGQQTNGKTDYDALLQSNAAALHLLQDFLASGNSL